MATPIEALDTQPSRTVSHGPIPFGTDAIVYGADGEAAGLAIKIQGRSFVLLRSDAGAPGPVWDTIFILNMSEDYNIEMFESASDWFAQRMVNDRTHIVINPPSSKSQKCIRYAAQKAQQQINELDSPYEIQFIQLVGGKTEADIATAAPGLTEQYYPITSPAGKFIGIKAEDAARLREQIDNGEDVIVTIVDDVLSSGKTLEAIRTIIDKVDSRIQVKVIVLAHESTEPFPPLPPDTTAAIQIVEIAGGISPTRLPPR